MGRIVDCDHCVAKSCTTTACRWLLQDSLSSLRCFRIRCYQVTKMFRSGHDCTSTSSDRSPRYFRPQADITIWVLRKVRIFTVLTRARYHFCSRLHWKFMRWLGSVLTSLLWVSPKALLKYFHQPNSLGTPAANPASHALCLFVLLLIFHFYFLFSVSVDLCSGFLCSSSLTLPLISGTALSVDLLT